MENPGLEQPEFCASGLRERFAALDAEFDERLKGVDLAAVVPDNAGAERAHYIGEFEPMMEVDRDRREPLTYYKELMKGPTPSGHSGGKSGRRREQKKRRLSVVDAGIRFDQETAELERIRIPASDVVRAEESLRESAVRMEQGPRPGRPRIGKEARMVVSARVEPATVLAIAQTGLTYAEFLERATFMALNQGITWDDARRAIVAGVQKDDVA